MNRGIIVGRISGAPIHIGWSWAVLVPVVAVALYASIDPADGGSVLRGVAAIAGSLLLLASVVVHEAGHAVAAAMQDIPVQRVAVFLLGGFSEIELEDASPGQEARIVLAGPLVSGVLGAALVGIGATPWVGGGVEHILLIMAIVNFGVAAFNLIPAFPLDGGRLVRTALTAQGMERRRAEALAAMAGIVLGSAMVVMGVVASLLRSAVAVLVLPVGVMVVVLGISALGMKPDSDTVRKAPLD